MSCYWIGKRTFNDHCVLQGLTEAHQHVHHYPMMIWSRPQVRGRPVKVFESYHPVLGLC